MVKKYVFLWFLGVSIVGCTPDEPVPNSPQLTDEDRQTIAYFKEVALGFEFGSASAVTRRWENESLRIFVGGTPTAALSSELTTIVSEINALTTSGNGFRAEIVADSTQSNFYIFFGTGDAYASLYPSQQSLVNSNWGLFSLYWNADNSFTRGHMYVDIRRADATAQRHLLREELTQSLGLARDSERYDDSIFQQRWTVTTTYAPIDKELIRLLYHPQMAAGLSASEAEIRLTDILLGEKTLP